MRPKSIILLVLALGCGLVASIGINQVLGRPKGGSARETEMSPIYVALTEIGVGDPLSPSVLKLEEWPKSKVPAGSLGKLEEVDGRRCRTKFYPGEPILDAKLLGKGEKATDASGQIPKGFRVCSVRVDAVSSTGGLILPGDRVDVLVHVGQNEQRGIPETITQTFLQNVKVFAVDDVFLRDKDGEQAVASKTIALLVTPEQAERVTMATQLGEIRLIMRSANDPEVKPTEGTTVRNLFPNDRKSLAGSGTPVAPPAAQPPAGLLDFLNKGADKLTDAGPEPKPGWHMAVMAGSETREFHFSDTGGRPEEVTPGAGDGSNETEEDLDDESSAPDSTDDAGKEEQDSEESVSA